MPALATLVITATLASGPIATPIGPVSPPPDNLVVQVDLRGGGGGLAEAIGGAIESARSGGEGFSQGSGNGNGNGNGNVGFGNGNNNSGNNNGNNNSGNNNGNSNSGNNNGNNNVTDGNGNGNATDGNGNGNNTASNESRSNTVTNINGNTSSAMDRDGNSGLGVTRNVRPGAASNTARGPGVVVCQRVRFLWMTELRCN